MPAPRRFPSLLLLVLIALLGGIRVSSAYSVPTSFTFQGYLVDQYGSPITTATNAPLQMRFGLYINGTRVWYVQYSAVNVIGGSFTVNLGADSSVAQSLDPSTGSPLDSEGVTPITPALLTNVTDSTPVAVQIEIANDSNGYDTLTPNVPVNSSLFALRSETIAGYTQAQLAKMDSSGDILDGQGNVIISSNGAWEGSYSGPEGPQGVQGPAGAQGDTGATGQGFSFDGAWNGDSEYGAYDVVTFDGSVWVATTSPEGSPEEDSAWSLFASGFGYEGTWSNSPDYFTNDVVNYNGTLYIALDQVYGGEGNPSPPPEDTEDWAVFTQGFNFTGQYNSNTSYNPYDIVTFDGSAWVAQGTPGGAPEYDDTWVQFAGGYRFLGTWGSGIIYFPNNIVYYNGSL